MTTKIKKMIFTGALAISLSGTGSVANASAPCDGFMGSMMSMGYNMFEGMSSMVPFFGGMAKKAKNKMMARMFNEVLNNPRLTTDFMRCAFVNPTIVKMMTTTINSRPPLLDKMAMLMRYDLEFTETFIALMQVNWKVYDFAFSRMNPMMIDNMAYQMAISPRLVKNFTWLYKHTAKFQVYPNSRFVELMYEVDDEDVKLGRAIERMIYSVFSDLESISYVMDGNDSLTPENKALIMNLLFLADKSGEYDPTAPSGAQQNRHIYAIVNGLVKSIVPAFDKSLPMDPESDNLANALMAKFMGHMMDQNGMTAYGLSFFRSVMSMGLIHQDPDAMTLLGFMREVFPEDMFENAPMPDESAVEPRDYLSMDERIHPGIVWFPPSWLNRQPRMPGMMMPAPAGQPNPMYR